MKKLLCVLICAVLVLPCLSVGAEEAGPVITVSELTAVPGDTVFVSVDISKNPGIMAMTFTVSYDTSAFEFQKYKLGIRNDYLIVNHTDKGYVSFVNCEMSDKKKNGNLFVLVFTVKEKAAPKRYEFNIMNINPEKAGDSLVGCFANESHTEITPTVINGGVAVGKTCSNSGHTYGDYKVVTQPSCVENGIRARACTVCGHTESEEIEAVGHSFESQWTVDRPATADLQGIMSRHCENCEAVADKVYFSLETAESNTIENTEGSGVTEKDWDELEKFDKNSPTVEEKTDNSANDENSEANAEEAAGKYASFWKYFLGSGDDDGLLIRLAAALKQFFLKFSGLLIPVILIIL